MKKTNNVITKNLLSQLYDEAKVKYELAEDDYFKMDDIDGKKSMLKELSIYLGEMTAYKKLLEMLI